MPLLLSTPTWRAGRERITAAGLTSRDLNCDNSRFLAELRDSYGDYAQQVAICGLMSCRGDAYRPAEAMSAEAAAEFHTWQADALAAAGVDFLLAATLPALSGAIGLAQAQAATELPYVISFVARPEGTLLDGTPLDLRRCPVAAGVRQLRTTASATYSAPSAGGPVTLGLAECRSQCQFICVALCNA